MIHLLASFFHSPFQENDMKRILPLFGHARVAPAVVLLSCLPTSLAFAGTSGTNDDSLIAIFTITFLLFLLGVVYLFRLITTLASPPPDMGDATPDRALWRASSPSDDEDDPTMYLGLG
jgi:hypothetical protein